MGADNSFKLAFSKRLCVTTSAFDLDLLPVKCFDHYNGWSVVTITDIIVERKYANHLELLCMFVDIPPTEWGNVNKLLELPNLKAISLNWEGMLDGEPFDFARKSDV